MATLTGQAVQSSYKDLLQVSNSNAGIDGTLRAISDGEATASVLELSTAAVNISSGFELAGVSAQTGSVFKHETGGLEFDASAIADGGIVVGTASGTMALRASFLTAGAAGFVTHEVGGIEIDISAITTDEFLVGTSSGVIGVRSASQARTHLGLVIGTDVPSLGANTFTADQTISSTNAGAAEGPGLDLHRVSASPAASDVLGALRWKGEDSASNAETYAKLTAVILDPTTTSEDGKLVVTTVVAGTLADRFHFGAGIFANSFSDPGADKIAALLGWQYGSQTATTSGTSVALSTAIDSGAEEIEVIFRGVGTDANSEPPVVQLGHSAGTYITSGYLEIIGQIVGTSAQEAEHTDGFHASTNAAWNASDTVTGIMRLVRWDTSEHIWQVTMSLYETTDGNAKYGTGEVDVTSALDSIQLTTPSGTDAFNAGEARVRWR